jgi:hypothetical protein
LDLWAFRRLLTANTHIESFNEKFRTECLNANWILSLDEATQNTRLGVKTITTFVRITRSAAKCLESFMGATVRSARPIGKKKQKIGKRGQAAARAMSYPNSP